MSIMFYRVRSLSLLTAFAAMLFAMPSYCQEPFGAGSIQSGLTQARQAKRIVLVDFYTLHPTSIKIVSEDSWMAIYIPQPGLLNSMEETLWKDKAAYAWLTKTTISRRINVDKQPELAAKYKLHSYPTILLLKPDGAEIDRLIGLRDAKTFLAEVKQALAGQDSLARAKSKIKIKADGIGQLVSRLRYAELLAERDRYPEALKEYLLCLEERDKRGADAGVIPLTLLLSDLARLGKDYPPALTALTTRRDALHALLQNSSAAPSVATDLVEYNDTLGQQADTLAVYDRIKATNAPAAAILFRSLANQFLEHKRYAEFLGVTENLPDEMDAALAVFKPKPGNAPADKQTEEMMRLARVELMKQLGGCYEALLGTDKTAEADRLSSKLLLFDHSRAMYADLMRHAVRAGKPESSQKLREAAKSALSAADFAQLEKIMP